MQERLIARIGLCAAAAVFAASLGVLMFQGAGSDATPVRSMTPAQTMTPAQIQSANTGSQAALTGPHSTAAGI